MTCPVGTLRDGSPVSITLFAVQRCGTMHGVDEARRQAYFVRLKFGIFPLSRPSSMSRPTSGCCAVRRFDMRLLAVAQKLAPMIQESFFFIKEEITRMVRGEWL